MIASVRQMYQESWFGHPTGTSRGRTLLVGVSIIVLFASVLWLGQQNAERERDALAAETAANERARLVSEYVTCLQAVQAGSQIKATAMAGVEHAESTAALWLSVVEILREASPDSTLVARIDVEVDLYVIEVAEFRRVAEEYEPPHIEECGSPPGQVTPTD
jgi:hypothetical protein